MPTALVNLYASAQDVYSYLGVPATEMRLDDNNLATGQTVLVATDAQALDTTVMVAPLQRPMMKGNTLRFSGGGLANILEVSLGATALVGATSMTVPPLSANLPAQAIAADSGVNTALAARLLRACTYGTSQVQLWCMARYTDADLATSWNANRWATTLAAEWLARRVLRPMPETLKEDAKQVREELKMVRYGQLNVEGIGTRTAGWPFLDAVSVNPAYTIHKARIEQSLSEGTPLQFAAFPDWTDAFWGAMEGYW